MTVYERVTCAVLMAAAAVLVGVYVNEQRLASDGDRARWEACRDRGGVWGYIAGATGCYQITVVPK